MDVIIYNDQDHPIIQTIETRILSFKGCKVIRTTDHKSFEQSLGECFAGECIIIFFVNSKKDMIFLESNKINFLDIKLIIYLTIEDNTIVSKAYTLSPRMVITSDSSGKELLPAAIGGIIKFKNN